MAERIIAYVDKTIVRINGLQIKSIKPVEVEKVLQEKIGRPARVIGVTGESLQLDIYGLEPEAIMLDEKGIIQAISMVPGLSATEIAQIDQAERIRQVDVAALAQGSDSACPKERWNTRK